ncbi:MAG: hypothetical protein GSR84_05245 [Desulfurococcales archaeon]|nr:hypothetical protein [Desulfurococcales archaeon]
MATKKITIEVEVPEWVSEWEAREAIVSAARRAVLYLALERAQRREPNQEEVEELAGEAKRSIYRRVMEDHR